MNAESAAKTLPHGDAGPRGAAGGGAPCYREVTPQELRRMNSLVIVALKVPQARDIFQSFRQVIALGNSAEIVQHLPHMDPAQPLALVCQDGECSGRLALRLAAKGYTVVHLAGGLREWNFCMRQA